MSAPAHRTLSEILRDADAATEVSELQACWKEIMDTRYQRPLVDLEFAREHLVGLAGAMGARDGAELRSVVEPGFNAMGIYFKKP